MAAREQHQESRERQKQGSKGGGEYGSGAGSSGPGQVTVRSHTPENRSGEINPSAPTDSTEGPSTNLATDQADGGTGLGASRGEPARGETKANQRTINKSAADKPDAA